MASLLKSDLFRRFSGGFLAGALVILLTQPPEGAAMAVQALKAAAGIA